MSMKSELSYPRSKSNKYWHGTEKIGVFESKDPKKGLKKQKKYYIDACSKEGWQFILNNENMLIPRSQI